MGEKNTKPLDPTEDKDSVTFDHFEVLRSIGKGSFGKVCIVRKKTGEKTYAMKYMNKMENWRKGYVDSIMNELYILAQVQHPFLVNLWFTFQDEEDIFMVSDLLLGGDLRYHINKDVVFSENDIRLYLCQLALVLDYLKSQKIIHRDIKPDNLLLDEKGFIYLTDFNVATRFSDAQTLSSSFAGTMPYAAPEMHETAQGLICGYDYSVDWWSLGVTIYEIITHKRPFSIENSLSHSQAIKIIQNFTVHLVKDQASPIKKLITRLLQISPADRVSSFASLCELEFCSGCSRDEVLALNMIPDFTPSNSRLNYDPIYELEEMLVESNPLHKKNKRLKKRRSQKLLEQKKANADVSDNEEATTDEARLKEIEKQFIPYNRERLLKSESPAQDV